MFKFFNDGSFVEPSVWVKYAPNVPVSADFNLRYQLASSLWLGTGLATNGNFHIHGLANPQYVTKMQTPGVGGDGNENQKTNVGRSHWLKGGWYFGNTFCR